MGETDRTRIHFRLAKFLIFFSLLVGFASAVVPPQVTLSSPSNGANPVVRSPTLTWNPVSGSVDWYDVTICLDSGCFSGTQGASQTSTSYTASPALSTATTYWWHVRAHNTDGYGPYSSIWSFTTVNYPPAPTLNSPSNGAVGVSTTPTLSWNPVYGYFVQSYQIYLCSTSTCGTVLWVGTATGESASSIPVPAGYMTVGPTYYWKVRANGNAGYSTFSPTWSFSTGSGSGSPPPAPTLSSPTNGTTGVSATPTLSWNPVSGSLDFYRVLVCTDSNCASVTTNTTVSNTSTSYSASLSPGVTYFWKVYAHNSYGYSPPSPTWNFATSSGITYGNTTVTANGDTFADETAANTVRGLSNGMTAGFYGSTLQEKAIYASFSLSSLPAGAIVSNATCHFWATGSTINQAFYLRLRKPLPSQTWSESTLTWANQPSNPSTYTTWSDPNMQYQMCYGVTPPACGAYGPQGDIPFNCLSAVNDAIVNNEANLNVVLDPIWPGYSTYNTNEAYFASREDGNSTVRPRLEINYSIPTLTITNVNASPSGATATVTWTTSLASNSTVYYGPTYPNYGWTATDTNLVTSHSVQINDNGGGSTYYYKIRSCTSSGLCTNSSQFQFNWPTTPPPSPTLASPASGSTNVSLTPTLQWNPVTNAGVTSYIVTICTNAQCTAGTYQTFTTSGQNNNTLTVPTGVLSNASTYYWDVVAVNSYGNSQPSNRWSFTTGGTSCPVPTAVTLNSPTGINSTSATLSWSPSTLPSTCFQSYELHRSSGPQFSVYYTPAVLTNQTITSATDPGLSPSTTYYWRVRVFNTLGDPTDSNVVNATTPAAPCTATAPTISSITPNGQGNVTPSWTPFTGSCFNRYEVHRSTASGFTPNNSTLVWTITNASVNSTTISGQVTGTQYYYKVETCDSTTCQPSSQASAIFNPQAWSSNYCQNNNVVKNRAVSLYSCTSACNTYQNAFFETQQVDTCYDSQLGALTCRPFSFYDGTSGAKCEAGVIETRFQPSDGLLRLSLDANDSKNLLLAGVGSTATRAEVDAMLSEAAAIVYRIGGSASYLLEQIRIARFTMDFDLEAAAGLAETILALARDLEWAANMAKFAGGVADPVLGLGMLVLDPQVSSFYLNWFCVQANGGLPCRLEPFSLVCNSPVGPGSTNLAVSATCTDGSSLTFPVVIEGISGESYTPNIPSTPLTSTPESGSVIPQNFFFNWVSVFGAENYIFRLYDSSNTNFYTTSTPASSNYFLSVGQLAAGQSYSWSVQANNSYGLGNQSARVFFSTQPSTGAPTPPPGPSNNASGTLQQTDSLVSQSFVPNATGTLDTITLNTIGNASARIVTDAGGSPNYSNTLGNIIYGPPANGAVNFSGFNTTLQAGQTYHLVLMGARNVTASTNNAYSNGQMKISNNSINWTLPNNNSNYDLVFQTFIQPVCPTLIAPIAGVSFTGPTNATISYSLSSTTCFATLELHRSTNQSFTPSNTTLVSSTVNASSTQFFDNGLTPGTMYTWKLLLRNTLNATVVTNGFGGITPCVQPQAVQLNSANITSNSANLNWAQSNDTCFQRYELFQNGYLLSTVYNLSQTNLIATGLSPFTNYSFGITVCNIYNQCSSATNINITTACPQPSPTNASAYGASPTSINIYWNTYAGPSGCFNAWELHRAITANFTPSNTTLATSFTNPSVTFYSDSGLQPGTTYYYKVRTLTPSGNATSNTAPATTQCGTPPPVTLFFSNLTTNSVNLSWSQFAGGCFDRYEITRNGTLLTQINTQNTTSFVSSGLSPATSYAYSITACNTNYQCSTPSAISITTLCGLPSLVTMNVTNTSQTSITFNWQQYSGTCFSKYAFYQNGYSISNFTTQTTTSYTRTGLSPGTSYSFGIMGQNTEGQYGPMYSIYATTNNTPPVPWKTRTAISESIIPPAQNSVQISAARLPSYRARQG